MSDRTEMIVIELAFEGDGDRHGGPGRNDNEQPDLDRDPEKRRCWSPGGS